MAGHTTATQSLSEKTLRIYIVLDLDLALRSACVKYSVQSTLPNLLVPIHTTTIRRKHSGQGVEWGWRRGEKKEPWIECG